MASLKKRISILLAAGASTRMKSKQSKLLHPVLERPIIDWAVDQASYFGEKAVIVVGHQREDIEKRASLVAPKGLEVLFAHQKEQKGTADAVRTALEAISNVSDDAADIFIMGADSVLLRNETLAAFAKEFQQKKSVLSLMTARIPFQNAYGRIVRDSHGNIERIVEVKDATSSELRIEETNAGFYLITLKALREALALISNHNKSKEFYLTELVSIARSKSWLVTTHEITPEESFGVNNRADLALADRVLKLRTNLSWMEKGVTMIDPETIRIGPFVQLSSDVVLETSVQLLGKTHIASDVTIGSHTIVESSKVGEGTRVEAFCHLKEVEVHKQCTIGPYARLRPGTVLDDGVHIGNFVEIKKSQLAKGVKAGHLSYIGDATIGAESNIGAGTITCNYDGFSKFETKIGKNVFVGSNSALVAPLKLGDGVIVGAGSVITKDVAKDALVLERSEQIEKRGRAKIFRENRKKD
jgi:bifunctional UDP-N-acetylglucosamine pyrophosphorylase/glucosamine-1-phosphate N-acetyltransferase